MIHLPVTYTVQKMCWCALSYALSPAGEGHSRPAGKRHVRDSILDSSLPIYGDATDQYRRRISTSEPFQRLWILTRQSDSLVKARGSPYAVGCPLGTKSMPLSNGCDNNRMQPQNGEAGPRVRAVHAHPILLRLARQQSTRSPRTVVKMSKAGIRAQMQRTFQACGRQKPSSHPIPWPLQFLPSQ